MGSGAHDVMSLGRGHVLVTVLGKPVRDGIEAFVLTAYNYALS
jgi:hypothetical protein